MERKLFDSLMEGIREMEAFAQGSSTGVTVHHVHIPDAVDVKAIRKSLAMTQVEFSHTFGFGIDSVRSWESGRRVPDNSAKVLLKTIAFAPNVVLQANAVGTLHN